MCLWKRIISICQTIKKLLSTLFRKVWKREIKEKEMQSHSIQVDIKTLKALKNDFKELINKAEKENNMPYVLETHALKQRFD